MNGDIAWWKFERTNDGLDPLGNLVSEGLNYQVDWQQHLSQGREVCDITMFSEKTYCRVPAILLMFGLLPGGMLGLLEDEGEGNDSLNAKFGDA